MAGFDGALMRMTWGHAGVSRIHDRCVAYSLHCNLPHPGFVVLHSPLVTYREPDRLDHRAAQCADPSSGRGGLLATVAL
jgi:hypothetical protein